LELASGVDLAIPVFLTFGPVDLAGEELIGRLERRATFGDLVAELYKVAGGGDLDGTAATFGGGQERELMFADRYGVEMGDACSLMRRQTASGSTLATALTLM
jgi:hypothetical protein